MNRKSGFTLVELITVLIIIVILAAFLYPKFPAHERAKQVSCASNLKQIGLGIIQYAQDNDEYLPPRQSRSGTRGELVSWRYSVYPYIKSKQIYQCPESTAREAPDIERDGFMRSYGVNSTTVAKRGASGPFSDCYGGKSKLTSIAHPASVIMITETTAAFNDMNVTLPLAFTSPFDAQINRGSLFAGHDHYANCLFADGHVKRLRPLHTLAGGVNPWTRDASPFSGTERQTAAQVLRYAADRGKPGE